MKTSMTAQKRSSSVSVEQPYSAIAPRRSRSSFLPTSAIFFPSLICALGIIRHRGHLVRSRPEQRNVLFCVSWAGTRLAFLAFSHQIAVSMLISASSPMTVRSTCASSVPILPSLIMLFPCHQRPRFTCINELEAWALLLFRRLLAFFCHPLQFRHFI